MSSSSRGFASRARHRSVLLLAAPAFVAGFGQVVAAQAFAPDSSRSQLDTPEAQRLIEAEAQEASLNPAAPSYVNPNPFLTWGPVTARPHLVTRFSYGNSLRSRTGANANSVIEEISPGSLFELGSKWRLDYTPTLAFYSNKEFRDTLSHGVGLTGHTAYENWVFGLSQTYSSSSQPLIETGRQTDQESFITALSASYYFNSKVMLELGLNQNFESAEEFSSSRTWSTMDWLNCQISQRVSVAAGVGGGYQDVTGSPDMSYEQFQGRINSRIADKLTLSLNGGAEVRQILISGADPLVNPIYGASMIYRPFQVTTLSLSGNRTIEASLLRGDVSESTSISAAVTQRFLGAVYVTLSGAYRNSRYIRSSALQSLDREDDTLTLSASVSYALNQHLDGLVFYNYNDNSSTTPGFDFISHQVGLQLAYRF